MAVLQALYCGSSWFLSYQGQLTKASPTTKSSEFDKYWEFIVLPSLSWFKRALEVKPILVFLNVYLFF